MKRERIDPLLSSLQNKFTYLERLRIISKMFLGARYSLGPLGEGPKGQVDKDPLFRLDRVDCVTYVETVMALAQSKTLSDAKTILQKIRYRKGIIGYGTRNHLTVSHWLTQNQAAGFVHDLTESFGPNLLRTYTQQIHTSMWKAAWTKGIPKAFLPKTYSIQYLPLTKLNRVLQDLPKIAWMAEVKHRPHHPMVVKHVGFLIKKNGRNYFRHANVGRRGVRENNILWHTKKRLLSNKRLHKKTPFLGYLFAEFLPPRRS